MSSELLRACFSYSAELVGKHLHTQKLKIKGSPSFQKWMIFLKISKFGGGHFRPKHFFAKFLALKTTISGGGVISFHLKKFFEKLQYFFSKKGRKGAEGVKGHSEISGNSSIFEKTGFSSFRVRFGSST